MTPLAPDFVPEALAQVLGVQTQGLCTRQEQRETALAERGVLLVLDNVEHVMAALLAARLLEAAPGIRLLDAGLNPLRLCRVQRVEAGGQRSLF